MKKNPTVLLIGVTLAAGLASTLAQTTDVVSPTPAVPLYAPPPIPLTNITSPFSALANMLPLWNPSLTNTFNANEIIFTASPLWKSQSASGSTPFLSTSADYYFSKHFGARGELVTLGNGAGSSTVDSLALDALLRGDIGNICGYAIVGAAFDKQQNKPGGEIGVGFAYRYNTCLEIFSDTRWRYEGKAPNENGFLTRVGINLAFGKW